jgi:hypothetical protein
MSWEPELSSAAIVIPPSDVAGAAGRYGWFAATDFLRAFAGGAAARRQAAARWWRGLPEEQRCRRGHRLLARGDALLPHRSVAPGVTVSAFLQSIQPPERVAPDAVEGSERLRQKTLDAMELLRRDRQFRSEHAKLAPTSPAYFENFRRVHGAWARERGLGCGRSAMLSLRKRAARCETIDKRAARSGRKPAIQIDPRVADAYLALALHANRFSLREAWRAARDRAEELGVTLPSEPTMRRWFRRHYPEPVRRLAQSPKRFEAACLPKIAREYSAVAPLEWISLDGHVLNLRAQAPDAAKTGRAIRPVLTGALDVRTRTFVGSDIRATENSDGILAGLMQMHRDYGCARNYYYDNGQAYKAGLGARLRPKLYEDPRIGDLCRETGATRHHAVPYQGWAKMIESTWRQVVERFERYFASWFGNRIDTRPDDAAKLPVWQLPTLDDVRAAWAEFLRAYHAEPQTGDGMYGLSPNLALEQFRTEVRRVDESVLRFRCACTVGYRKVGRDGVRIAGVQYGAWDEDVFRWQGRRVLVRRDPDDAGYVWLYDEQARDVVIAHNRKLTGATQEDVRAAARHRARLRRLAKEYLPARDFLLDTTPQQIMRRKAERAQARERRVRAELPAAAAPDVTLVRPDLVEPVQRARQRQAAALQAAAPAVRAGFERLAQRAREDEIAAAAEQARPSRSERLAAYWRRMESAG